MVCGVDVACGFAKLKIGDTFRVLESDGNSVLIKLIGNKNNPYFLSKNFLKQISNYNDNVDDI